MTMTASTVRRGLYGVLAGGMPSAATTVAAARQQTPSRTRAVRARMPANSARRQTESASTWPTIPASTKT